MTDVIMIGYDIKLNENNQLEVEAYDVHLERDKDNHSFYTFKLIDSKLVTPEELPEVINNLKKQGAFSLTRLEPTSFMIDEGNIPYLFRSLILPCRNKLLEKVYTEDIIDDVCHVALYVTYVNVNTGELFALKVNDLGAYSEELEAKMENMEFKPIGVSFLGNYMNKVDSSKQKPLSLTRSK